MNFNLLINLFDSHNEASIILTEKYMPKNVLFFYTLGYEVIQLEKLKKYFYEKFPKINFDYKKLDVDNPKQIEEIITSYEGVEGVYNLTSGKKLATLMIYTFCIKHNIDCKYVDIKNAKIMSFNTEGIKITQDELVDLDIEDIINSIGASIIIDSTELYTNRATLEFSHWISKNMELWNELKLMLQDTLLFIRDENNPDFFKISKERLNQSNKNCLLERLNFLTKYEQISIKEDEMFYKLYFRNDFIKTFLFKSGTWLEIITQEVTKSFDKIDDVKSGLLFLWDNNKSNVRNELDVVAVKDSVMICISCKDSKKYDECALNELDVYANQIGGENVIKILVATKEPTKSTVMQRAKEMNIHIIIFDGNLTSFKNKLLNVINE